VERNGSKDPGRVPRALGALAVIVVAVAALSVPVLFSSVVTSTTVVPPTTLPPETTSTSEPEPTPAEEPWVKQSLPGSGDQATVADLAGAGATVVAVGTRTVGTRTCDWGGCRPAAWVSLDRGTTFLAIDLGSPRFTVTSVAATDDGFVAVGSDGEGDGMVWRSADGINWDRSTPDDLSGVMPTGVADGPEGLLVSGYCWAPDCGIAVFTSSDGAIWSGQVLDPQLAVYPIAAAGYDGGYTVATLVSVAGDDPERLQVWTSSNGRNWRVGTAKATSAGLYPIVAVSSHGMVANSSFMAGAVFSPDGTTWNEVVFDDPGACPLVRFTDVVTTGSGFVASGRCGNVAAVWASDTGEAWRLVARDGDVFGGGQYFVYTDDGGMVVIGNESGEAWSATPAAP
jgi:hypothetical protein